jgi:ferrochelatase
MNRSDKVGLLLINLGTPDSTSTADLRNYLGEFLMDPRVLEMPTWRRWLLVHLLILPVRAKKSAAAYRKIWTPEGSPLLVNSRNLQRNVQHLTDENTEVVLAMRYGNPSIEAAFTRFAELGINRIVVFPLFPQYSSAVTGSILERVCEVAERADQAPSLQIVPPFYDHPSFIDAWAATVRPVLKRTDAEVVLFSFHGLPEQHIFQADSQGGHCLRHDGCCEQISSENRHCYRAQCFATAKLIADRLGVPAEQRRICFQSRLGRAKWIEPYTEPVLADLAAGGCRSAIIISPSFVADCLETLEELEIRARECWEANGGGQLEIVPSLNSGDCWSSAVATIAAENSPDVD